MLFALPAGAVATSIDTPNPVRCFEPDPGTPYYSIELVTTGKIPGTGEASGQAAVHFKRSPFGIAVTGDGSFVHTLKIEVTNINPPDKGLYVAWVTTPNLDQVKKIGPLGNQNKIEGTVPWNKYLVVITKETNPQQVSGMWKGPIILRGMSRSGNMHTMAGHGPFEGEPCGKFGF